jgi:hypothetical protein
LLTILTLLLIGLTLSIVGTIVEGLLSLTAIGIVTFLAAAAYAALAQRTGERSRRARPVTGFTDRINPF